MSNVIIAGAQSFTGPLTLSNLRFWLDFSDTATMNSGTPPTDGVEITQMTDKSANAFSFAGGGANQRPKYKTGIQNGLGAGLFDNNDFLSCNLTTDLTVVNLFFVGKSTANTAYNSICGSNVQDATTMNWEIFTSNSLDVYAATDHGTTGSGSYPVNTLQTAYMTYTSGTGVIGVNNVALGSFSTASLRFEATNFLVGLTNGGFQGWVGYQHELVCGAGSIWSATDLTNLHNWAKTKYNF